MLLYVRLKSPGCASGQERLITSVGMIYGQYYGYLSLHAEATYNVKTIENNSVAETETAELLGARYWAH